MSLALIALGANLGDPAETLPQAAAAIAALPGVRLLDASHSYWSAAVGGPAQPDYLNAAVLVETTLSPETLLKAMLQIENEFGRERHEHWGPRTLDLDLIAFDDEVRDSVELTLPHPRATQRRFVLKPLSDIAPDWQLGGRSVAEWLEVL